MGVFLIICVILFALGPWIMRLLRPWLTRMAARRMENYMRSAMGMPPQDKKKRGRGSAQGNASGRRARSGRGYASSRHEPIIPKEYAEDVEFVEFKEYSERTEIHADPHTGSVRVESQVEDAEFEMVSKKE